MKEFISHILKQVAAILEYVIAFMPCDRYHSALLPYGMFTSEYPSSEHLSKLR